MASIAGLKDIRKQGPPGDIGTFVSGATAIIFQFTFSGTTYTCAMASGPSGWVLIAYSAVGADNVEFQAAVDYVAARQNATIVIQAALYNMAAVVTITNPVTITGEGSDVTTLFYPAGSTHNMFEVSNTTDVSFYRMTIDMNHTNVAYGANVENQHPIKVESVTRFRVGQITFDDIIISAVGMRQGVVDASVIDCEFYGSGAATASKGAIMVGGILPLGTGDGLDRIVIANNKANITQSATSFVMAVKFDHLTCVGNTGFSDGACFYIDPRAFGNETATVVGNTMDTPEELVFVNNTGAGPTIVGNVCYGATRGAVDTYGDVTVIVGNYFYGPGATGSSGIRLHSNDNMVFNNYVTNFGNGYGVEVYATFSGNWVKDNYLMGNSNGPIGDFGDDTKLATIPIQLVQGTTFISTAGEAWGWEIDADTEFALGIGWLPLELQQIVRIRIIGVGLAAPGAGNEMRAQFTGEAATFDEVFTTHSIDVVDLDSEETNFAIDDVIHWILDSTDDADIANITGGDRLQLKVLHEGAGGGSIATDAIIDSIQVEYV